MTEFSPEATISLGLALKSFQVVRYAVLNSARTAAGYQYTAATLAGESEITIGLTVAALGTVGDLNDVVATFETQTVVSVIGIESLPHPAENTVVIPDPVMANIINIAFGTSRGALAVKSDGRLLMPLLDVTSLVPKTNTVTTPS